MTTYTVNLGLDQDTREYLKGHGYSLYVFKGIDAGGGAVSTVWQIINGDHLYNQDTITIEWEENYYIGETTTSISQSGVVVSGVNPYISGSNIQAVKLGFNYIYSGVKWNPDPSTAPTQTAFFIENDPQSINNFYVSQKASKEPGNDYIVVQEILGDGGSASFTPVQVIALILSTSAVKKGAIVIQAFSPGVKVTLEGSTSATLSYNKDKGWNGPSSQVTKLPNNTPIYTSLLQSQRSWKRSKQKETLGISNTLAPGDSINWIATQNYQNLRLEWTVSGVGAGSVEVTIPNPGQARNVNIIPDTGTVVLVNGNSGKIVNNTGKSIWYTLY